MYNPPQRERILADLRRAKPEAVCGTHWLANYMPRYSAVIWTLRHAYGFEIDGRACDMHQHEGEVYMFRLIREPVTAQPQEQLSWLG